MQRSYRPRAKPRRYTEADNSVVVATDTQKQTVYVLAKQHPVTPPELFASILADHFVAKYTHIHAAHVHITVHRWTRLTVDGKPHPHSFIRDGEEKRVCEAVAREGKGITIESGITGLLVLKSTGSAFYGFHRDEYTRLPEVWDRILSTEVESTWHWTTLPDLKTVQSEAPKFDKAYESARGITLDTFAKDESPSVQNTMWKMSEQILAAVPEVHAVDYKLPNKHYFEVGKDIRKFVYVDVWRLTLSDLSWFDGLKNTGKDAEVYAPQSDPSGMITCTVTRD